MLTRREEFGVFIRQHLDNNGLLMAKSRGQKEAAAAAIHDELHQWAAEHFPMGCSAEFSEAAMRQGLKAVRSKVVKMSDAECEERYGVPILMILGMIPTLISWISTIWKWWQGESQS